MTERNALAELASRLSPNRMTYDDLDMAQRIVAKLAKVESLYEKMNAMAINGRIVEAEELAHELHLAEESMLANCRAIAEEGAK